MRCCVCNKVVPKERVKFLLESGVFEHSITCVAHSLTKPKKGIYSGEPGTSDLIICDKVYNDSVRSKFNEAEEEADVKLD